jgi:hypothetical protein
MSAPLDMIYCASVSKPYLMQMLNGESPRADKFLFMLKLLLRSLDWRRADMVIVGVTAEKVDVDKLTLRHRFTSAEYFSTKILAISSRPLLQAKHNSVSPFLSTSFTLNVIGSFEINSFNFSMSSFRRIKS